jgi:hypothetical protein
VIGDHPEAILGPQVPSSTPRVPATRSAARSRTRWPRAPSLSRPRAQRWGPRRRASRAAARATSGPTTVVRSATAPSSAHDLQSGAWRLPARVPDHARADRGSPSFR